MRALIIGGNRFFGRHLALSLLADGAEVTLLNRGKTPDGLGPALSRIVADRTDKRALATAISGDYDVVFDQVCFTADDAEAACEIFAGRTPLYVVTSTLSVYDLGADLPESAFDPYSYAFTEKAPRGDMALYGEAKRQMEAVLFQRQGRSGFRVIAPRFPIVLGVDDYTQRLIFHVERIKNQKPIFLPNLEARMTFIDSSDAGKVLHRVGTLDSFSGPVNCSSPDPIKIGEMMLLIERATGKEGIFTTDPKGGEPSPFGVPEDYFASTSRLESLGIHVRPLRSWLPELIEALGVSGQPK